MYIIPKETEKVQYDYNLNHFLHFHVQKGSMSDFLDFDLPYPTYLERINKGYLIAWAIDGYFATTKGKKYFDDIATRFLIDFADNEPKRLPYKPKFKASSNAKVLERAYQLKQFDRCLQKKIKKNLIPQRTVMFEDEKFWAIKLHAEDLIRTYSICSYEMLIDFAELNYPTKEKSTLKAKCRSIFNYYEQRNFELPKRRNKKYKDLKTYLEETTVSRTNNMITINKQRAFNKRSVIESLITGKYADKYKKKNGKFNAVLIAKATKFSEKTVRKYLKELSPIIRVNEWLNKED